MNYLHVESTWSNQLIIVVPTPAFSLLIWLVAGIALS